MEIRLVNRVEDGPKCFLHDAVSQGGDAQRALFAIVLGYVDSPDGLRLVRSALQLVDERRYPLVVRLERVPRRSVHAVGLAARSHYPFSRYVHPVVPVQQVVRLVNLWSGCSLAVFAKNLCFSAIFVGFIHPSSGLVRCVLHSSNALLRHVAGFPDRGLLRGLCPTSGIGRRLAYSGFGSMLTCKFLCATMLV